jgi:osmotically-inducible protein OsmY
MWLMAAGMVVSLRAAQVKPDNSATNKSDRAQDRVTADQQPNDKSDLETSRRIRHEIVADKSLSLYAHNIKVITQRGKVTLRGPVRSEAEREAIQAKAIEVAGAMNVTSTITVVPVRPRKAKTS